MKNQSECGRTLIEVIGVLAVVGLLTVGTMKWFESLATRMAVNDLVEEARKRALAVDKNGRFSSHPMTKGMFDRSSGYGENRAYSNVTAAGYAVGDNETNGFKIVLKQHANHRVAFVPVGRHGNIGKPLSKSVCEAVIKQQVYGIPKIGEIWDVVYDDGCTETNDCGSMDIDDCENTPAIIRIGIRI